MKLKSLYLLLFMNPYTKLQFVFLILLVIPLSPCLAQKINPKRTCLFTAWHAGVGKSNNTYLNIEKSLAIRRVRKINAFNKSEYSYLSAGLVGHLNSAKLYYGATTQLQAGFAKLKHFWPTASYTYLFNESANPHRINIGLSYLPFKNCGIAYAYTINNKEHTTYNLKHHFGISVNLKHNKIKCFEPKVQSSKNSKK